MKHSATRALAIIEAMNLRPISFVRDLARDTGISKPSIVRLLGILQEDGYVERAGGAGAYVLTERTVRLSAGFRHDSDIVRIARPLMEALTDRIKWPLALGILDHGFMVVRHSTIPSSPLAWYRTTLYSELPLARSAMGLAVLAFMQPEQVKTIIEAAPLPAGFGTIDWAYLWTALADVRSCGYAIRRPGYGHTTISVSVPVIVGDEPFAGLSVTIFGKAMTVETAVARFLEPLTQVSKMIGAGMAELDEPDKR